ncbi:hypothetical protein [Spongiivirga citrea]|uniref:STAS/SEC14 domain-containing protein n=1 Tax=Spongiivirga citrea TaxID=1481457 RepID=A0A6M0CJJ5_9FLAO|nr:hypothetical protein [Spongiivirga citrea]NER18115.1 hypothetical protein [Spongiivirga citrea]
MQLFRDTIYYKEAIQVLNYPFGTFYLCDGFIVGEVKEDTVFSWDMHAKQVVAELSDLYGCNGKNLTYISNRVESYSIKPADWLKFYNSGFSLKGYAVVNARRKGVKKVIFEKLFVNSRLKTFNCLEGAIEWAKENQESTVSVA